MFLNRNVKLGAAIGLLVIVIIAAAAITENSDTEIKQAPGFTAPDIETGTNHSLKDYRGKWVLIDFSASWCTVCQQVKPILEKYYVEKKSSDIRFITISNEKDTDAYKKFAKKKEYSQKADWPHLTDPSSEIYVEYGVQALPTFVLIDPDGNIRGKKKGYLDLKELETFIEKNR